MPSAIQKKSYSSVTVYSIDEQAVWTALENFVKHLAGRPEVLAIVLFGSLAQGRLSVGSDVDVLLILAESERPFRERLSLYRPDHFPIDIDVFPYTLMEIKRGQPLAQEALAGGRLLWQKADWDLPGRVGGAQEMKDDLE